MFIVYTLTDPLEFVLGPALRCARARLRRRDCAPFVHMARPGFVRGRCSFGIRIALRAMLRDRDGSLRLSCPTLTLEDIGLPTHWSAAYV